jgi:hypothetical protein
MAYFDCIVGGSGKGNTLVVTCADDLAGATITCTNGTKTYTKTCPSTAPYEVTFYGLAAGTWTVNATVSGNTYTTTVVVVDCAALLGGFSWRTWVDTARFLDSSDYNSLDEVLADELAVRELCLEHACVDYLAAVPSVNADIETVINNDLFAKWVNNSDYALDILGANVAIKALMDTADKYFYGEWALMPQVPKMTSNTAPYGEVIESGHYSTFYAYLAFDGDASNQGWTDTNKTDYYLGYHFISPVVITECHFQTFMADDYHQANINTLQASNTGNSDDWTDLGSVEAPTKGAYKIKTANTTAYSYYRLKLTRNRSDSNGVILNMLQFYAWQPKGNVPVMTSNTAPYGTCVYRVQDQEAYKAFNNDVTTRYTSTGYSSSTPDYVGYKSVNPICAKKAYLVLYNNLEATHSVSYKIQGSNDGFANDVHDLTQELSVTVLGAQNTFVGDIELNNDDFYLYHRIIRTSDTGGQYARFCVAALQFYGRELSVSVPTMTGNTTPYGEASASSTYTQATGYEAYKAFDGNNSTWWSSDTPSLNDYIEYQFTDPITPKEIAWSSAHVKSIEVRGSNDGFETYDVVGECDNNDSTALIYYPLNNNKSYLSLRCVVTGRRSGVSSTEKNSFYTIQFYGLDYSEKEFEEGTTKKWLYDHGVELETPSLYGGATKKANCIDVASGSSGGVIYDIDITTMTNNNVVRSKVTEATAGNGYYGDTIVRDSSGNTNLAEAFITQAMLPNTVACPIVSINQAAKIYFANIYNNHVEFNELWLE